MNVQHHGHVGLDGAQKLQELAAAMPPMQIADDCAGGDVQRGEQCGRAMALIVVRASLGDAGSQRQHGLRAVQRLGRGLARRH
jgi:hypothetical protein